ncbi:MAG: sugar phosphate isomerase/epimerase and 4-hydroxyphenylpyruvate domain-containing protein [Neomegalonema sp.]|nr:sugar phosphate isomerase/epimerase and 4-hydroxyphenylpyruvate domain-containing protein [Neomegalonema sp.]
MKTSIATVSISGDLTEKLEAIAEAGFGGIEIFEQDVVTHDGAPAEVGRMVRDHGLEIMLFQPFRDFEGLPEPLRGKAFDRAERKFDLMQELGAELMLVCASQHPGALGGADRAAADFRELGERAAARGLRVGYEAVAWGRYIADHRDAWEIVRRADHPNVGLILDSFHTLGPKIEPESVRRIPSDKIFFVQLADAPEIEMDLQYRSRHFRSMPGEGDLAILRFMQAVVSTGYDGPVSLEIFNDQFRGGSPKTIAKDGYRALQCVIDDVRRSTPGAQIGPIATPARTKVERVEFIEFATRGAEAAALAALLRSLGFRKAGRHITKNLTLWRQGDIRLVLNEEEGDFAGSVYTMRGTSVCDIGLQVSSAADTAARAQALGAAAFSQPLSPGQLDIPAVRGLAGSVLHFVDEASGLSDVWSVEFTPVEDATVAEAGLARVDHIAQTMRYDEMLSWSLFYTTLFDLTKSPMVDVTDPNGLVRSQALQAPGRDFRITLNGAETHRTLAGAFLMESFGAPVQHIAFATDDIFASAARLKQSGFEPLPIPQNYYDDLASRFELSDEMVSAMKAAHVLYDQDARGDFFQIYSRPFGGGQFFEIVQRRGGYAGYGAPNAPFRIAAQKRILRQSVELKI